MTGAATRCPGSIDTDTSNNPYRRGKMNAAMDAQAIKRAEQGALIQYIVPSFNLAPRNRPDGLKQPPYSILKTHLP
jgi:hypothetical protein